MANEHAPEHHEQPAPDGEPQYYAEPEVPVEAQPLEGPVRVAAMAPPPAFGGEMPPPGGGFAPPPQGWAPPPHGGYAPPQPGGYAPPPGAYAPPPPGGYAPMPYAPPPPQGGGYPQQQPTGPRRGPATRPLQSAATQAAPRPVAESGGMPVWLGWLLGFLIGAMVTILLVRFTGLGPVLVR